MSYPSQIPPILSERHNLAAALRFIKAIPDINDISQKQPFIEDMFLPLVSRLVARLKKPLIATPQGLLETGTIRLSLLIVQHLFGWLRPRRTRLHSCFKIGNKAANVRIPDTLLGVL